LNVPTASIHFLQFGRLRRQVSLHLNHRQSNNWFCFTDFPPNIPPPVDTPSPPNGCPCLPCVWWPCKYHSNQQLN
jgi:hypothetical protein